MTQVMKSLEASTGIEPVYTDLQSITFHKYNNNLGPKEYQDICRTVCEHDTNAISASLFSMALAS